MTAADVLARELMQSFPREAARVLERCRGADVAVVLADMPPGQAAAVVRALSVGAARDAFAAMAAEAAGAVAGELPPSWGARLLQRAPAARRSAVLAQTRARHRAAIERALAQRPGTAGALLDPAVLALAPDVDVAFALEQVRAVAATARDRIHGVDRDGRLVGIAGAADLLAADPGAALGDVMARPVVTLSAADDAAAIAANSGWLRWRALPVVDRDGGLLGVVRYETVQKFVLDEAPRAGSGVALPLSLAELFWLGLVGMTDGLARAVAGSVEADDR